MMYRHKNGIEWRKIQRSDLPKLLELKNESWWGVHSTPIINLEDQQHWFDSLSHNVICMIARYEGSDVGFLLINNIDWLGRIASIGGGVHKNNRSKLSLHVFQAGTDFAFENYNFHRLGAEVLETNFAVQKIDIKELGFKVEGVRQHSVYKCGQYYNSLVLRLFKSEWEQQERVKGYGGSCCYSEVVEDAQSLNLDALFQ